MVDKGTLDLYKSWRNDWNKCARELLRVKLDKDQQDILYAIQHSRRVSVRSGTARGKDFVAAVASILFLYLTPRFNTKGELTESTKIVMTAPTGRQIKNIMIPEIAKQYYKLKAYWPNMHIGEMMADGIRFDKYKDWFLTGFKAGDESVEAWSGLHASNIMVVVTEASGMAQSTFDSIEGILQGNSRLVVVFNPNSPHGEAYNSTKSPQYKKFKLSCLDSPNVVAKKIIIPGQVDWEWVNEKVEKPGWAMHINESEMDSSKLDFAWEGNFYRPSNLFRIKVLGEFPEEGEDVLIPMSWVELAMQRWTEVQKNENFTYQPELILGVDVAGMGRDNSVFCKRYGNYVKSLESVIGQTKDATVHMQLAGKIKSTLDFEGGYAMIDTIGEGAGVYSRLIEQEVYGAVSAKFSEGAKDLTDESGEMKFGNMRAYCFWMLREALNPNGSIKLLLPPSDELLEELPELKYKFGSNAAIMIEPKEDLKKRIGRSPDHSDALAETFYPLSRVTSRQKEAYSSKSDLGIF